MLHVFDVSRICEISAEICHRPAESIDTAIKLVYSVNKPVYPVNKPGLFTKPIKAGLSQDKPVEEGKVGPVYVHFFTNYYKTWMHSIMSKPIAQMQMTYINQYLTYINQYLYLC